jgi:hypothetical protein
MEGIEIVLQDINIIVYIGISDNYFPNNNPVSKFELQEALKAMISEE